MQASIAKYLAQKQIQKSSDGLCLSDLAQVIGKPTASVAPVMQKEQESTLTGLSLPTEDGQKSSPLLSSSSSSSSSSSTNTAIESPDCDTHAKQQTSTQGPLLNGDQKPLCNNNSSGASTDNKYSSSCRTLDTPVRGAVSLLPSNLTNINNSSGGNFSTLNGDVDMEMDSQPASSNNMHCFPSIVRGRSNSVDSLPSPQTPGVWGDTENANVNGGSKNIYSAFSKSSAVSQVFTGKPQTAKVSMKLHVGNKSDLKLFNLLTQENTWETEVQDCRPFLIK